MKGNEYPISIRLSGFGGQGVILASVVIAKAAITYEGKWAIQTQDYGPESRGGASKADVIISDRDIAYPLIETADVLVALSQDAIAQYFPTTREDSLVIIDPTFVKETPKGENVRLVEIPTAKLADEIGNRLVANMVTLGALVALTSVVLEDSLEKSIRDNTPKESHSMNIRGMRAGVKYAQNIRANER